MLKKEKENLALEEKATLIWREEQASKQNNWKLSKVKGTLKINKTFIEIPGDGGGQGHWLGVLAENKRQIRQ